MQSWRRVTHIAGVGFLGVVIAVGVCLGMIRCSTAPELWGGADFSRVFTDRNGRMLRLTLTSDEKYRIFTPLEHIPGEMREATLLYEDRAFWRHPGVNPLAIGRAVFSMLRGGRRMGGSTITMQLVRLTRKMDTTTFSGKLAQMWQALILERHYSKQEILEAYLNLAPYGANVEGVGAAARVWFGKDAGLLNLPEILALVPVPQNPAARNPLAQYGRALPDARIRLESLWRAAHPESLEFNGIYAQLPLRVSGPARLPFEAPHALNGLLQELESQALPPYVNGVLRTTLDMDSQRRVERAIRQAVARNARWGMRNAAALLVDWRSGEIIALAGSADFHNPAIQGQVDGTLARRSPGSTLKPFIYALALEQGLIHPQTLLRDTPRNFRGYTPENADNQFRGPVSARQALVASRNIPAISLASQLAAPGLYGFLQKAGVRFAHAAEHYGLALVLGGAEVSMREVATLYAMLPNRGIRQPLRLVDTTAFGQISWKESATPEPGAALLLPEAAFVALDMLRAPSPQGGDRFVSYWKTGTSNGQRDAWTAGIFGPYVLVVWVGNFDGRPNPGFTGLHAAAPLFFSIAQALSGKEALPDLARENGHGLKCIRLPVCRATGDLNTDLCARNGAGSVVETWFIPGVSPIKDSGILREILVDTETGLRQCRDIPGTTKRVVWEFWPADLRRLFAQAGIHKPPPPRFSEECREGGALPGRPPEIISPRAGVRYAMVAPSGEAGMVAGESGVIPLLANVDSDVTGVFWFAGTRFLGKSSPEEPLYWPLTPGVTEFRVVDDLGRAGRLRVEVELLPGARTP